MSYLANRNVTLYTASTIKTYGVSNPNATQSANQSNGTFSNWITAKSSLQNLKKIAVSSTGQYEVAILQSTLWYSSDSGVTWTQPTAYGLPASATYSCGSVSADGKYITIGTTGDYLYTSQDRGQTFNNPAPTATPYAWLPLQGNTTDLQGNTITVSSSVPGYAGKGPIPSLTNAINFANTAGSTATQYVRGPWTGSPNFTVSFWMNPQTINGSSQVIFDTCTSAYTLYINPSNYLTWYFPTAGSSINAINTSFPLITNTWYYVTAIFQTNAVCSLYVNNSLVGTYVNTGGFGSSSVFGLGTYCSALGFAYNGYIADFRLYNSAITYQNIPVLAPYTWLKFENNTTDTMGASTMTVGGSTAAVSYVPGRVGQSAVFIPNTAGSTATTYLRTSISLTATPSFTISCWCNLLTSPTPEGAMIFSLGTASAECIEVSQSASSIVLYWQSSTGWSTGYNFTLTPAFNTWYHISLVYNYNSTCYLYLNNVQATTFTANFSLVTAPTLLTIGGRCNGATAAFNGYIEDFRFYNYAITPTTSLQARNWSSLSVSGSGQYQLAGADDGAVFSSSNYGASWALQPAASSAGSVRTLSQSHTGQYQAVSAQKWVQPNQSGITVSGITSTWSQGGVTWIASASSYYVSATFYAGYAFQTGTSNEWASVSGGYTNSAYSANTYSTTILGGVGAIGGDWLQIQSSVPLVLSSYSFVGGGSPSAQFPKVYYIAGSNDGATWYPVQYCNFTSTPFTGGYQSCANNLQVNYTGTQTLISGTTGSVTTTAYAYSTMPYTYFRMVITTVFGTTGMVAELRNWIPNFLAANTYSPQQTGLSSNTWQVNGVTYTASYSSLSLTAQGYGAFNNTVSSGVTPYSWLSAANYNSSGVYNNTYSTTVLSGIGAVAGEWLQIQTSIPMVMASYSYGCGGFNNLPKTYYIIGSTDGTNWYPIQYGSMTTNPLTANFSICSTYIIVNQSGAQSIIGNVTGAGTFTTYSTTTNAYSYFRIISTAGYSSSGTYFEIGEWYINFLGGQSYSTNYGATYTTIPTVYSPHGLTVSPSGQYQIGLNNQPVTARITLDNSPADGVGTLAAPTVTGTVTYSTSIYKTGTGSAYFNNAVGSTVSNYLTYTLPSALSTISTITISCWINPSAIPGSAQACFFAMNNGASTAGPYLSINTNSTLICAYYTNTPANGSINSTATVTVGSWTHVVATFSIGTVFLYVNGVVQSSGSYTGALSLSGGGNLTSLFFGGVHTGGYGYNGYLDDVRLYPYALTADQVNALYQSPNSQCLALTNNYLAALTSTPSLTYFLAGNTAPLVDAAISMNGQTMIVINSATTGNNVWYSQNAGQSWTAIAITTAVPLVSCAVSYDGTYFTVASATTVYTLNNNSANVYGVAIGNQAGLVGQGTNAIAIGNQAGQANQSANSIILNATGSAMNAYGPGFFVGPVVNTANTTQTSVNLLGYGADCQVTQTGITILNQTANGGVGQCVGIGTSTSNNSSFPIQALTLFNGTVAPILEIKSSSTAYDATAAPSILFNSNLAYGGYTYSKISGYDDYRQYNGVFLGGLKFFTSNNQGLYERMRIDGYGNVGIGTTNPTSALHLGLGSTANLGGALQTKWNDMGLSVSSTFSPGYNSTPIVVSGGVVTFTVGGGDTNGTFNAPSPIVPGATYTFTWTVKASIASADVFFYGNSNASPYRFTITGTYATYTYQFTAGSDPVFKFAPYVGANQSISFNAISITRLDTVATGNVGIGTTSPAAVLDVYGGTYGRLQVNSSSVLGTHIGPLADNTYNLGWVGSRWAAVYAVNGTIQTSDSSVKVSKPLSYGLSEILQMRTIQFKWKSQEDLPDDTPEKNYEYYGFCADELSPVFPELVYDEDKTKPVQMNYSEIMPVMVNAMKDLSGQLSTLSSKYDQLLSWAETQGYSPIESAVSGEV